MSATVGNMHSMTVGNRGPVLMEDYHLTEKLAQVTIAPCNVDPVRDGGAFCLFALWRVCLSTWAIRRSQHLPVRRATLSRTMLHPPFLPRSMLHPRFLLRSLYRRF